MIREKQADINIQFFLANILLARTLSSLVTFLKSRVVSVLRWKMVKRRQFCRSVTGLLMRINRLRRLQELRLQISEKSQILLLIRIRFSRAGRLAARPITILIRLLEALTVLRRSRQEKLVSTWMLFSLRSMLQQQLRVAAVLLSEVMARLRRLSSRQLNWLTQQGAELMRAAVRDMGCFLLQCVITRCQYQQATYWSFSVRNQHSDESTTTRCLCKYGPFCPICGVNVGG